MSVVVSFRIPEDLKKRMDDLKGRVNWNEEVRKFLEDKVKEYERQMLIEKANRILSSLNGAPGSLSND